MNTSEDFGQYFKNKRDQYLVDIRKQKSDQMILNKRMKLTLESSDDQPKINNRLSSSSYEHQDAQQLLNDLATSFCSALKERDYDLLSEVTECIRRTISRDDQPPLTPLINTNIVPCIANLLDPENYGHESLMRECTWIMANIASGSLAYVKYLIGLDMISKAMTLFEHPNTDVKEHAVWILANFAGESIEFRDELLDRGIVTKIEYLFQGCSTETNLISQIAWLISVLVKGKPFPKFCQTAPLLKFLQYFLVNFEDRDILTYTLWSLSSISEGDYGQVQEVYNINPCVKLIEMVNAKDLQLKVPALRTIGNLLTADDNQAQILLEAGVLEALVPLMIHSRKLIRRESCWALSNIMAGKYAQIDQVFQFQKGMIIKRLFKMINTEDIEVSKECTFCLTNACSSATIQQIIELVDNGLIEMLVGTLKENSETRLLKACLEALESILSEYKDQHFLIESETNPFLKRLEQCNGYQVIEDLQQHPDFSIYETVTRLIENYFDFE